MKKEKYIAPKIEVIKTVTESLLQSATVSAVSTGAEYDPDANSGVNGWINGDIDVDNGSEEIDPD